MSLTNNHSSDSNAPAYVTAINSALTNIFTRLPSIDITPDEREEMPKIDARFKVFVENEIMAIKNNSSLFPSNLSVIELQKDLEIHNGLDDLALTVDKLALRLKAFQFSVGN